jgi:hypothetical protein
LAHPPQAPGEPDAPLSLAALALLGGSTGRRYPDRDELRAAVHELAARGLEPPAIARALGIEAAAVMVLLG